jgi:hypothetical protein
VLVGSGEGNINIICLFGSEFGELSIEGWQVESGDLLVELLGEDVDLSLFVLGGVFVLPEFNLGEHLVGE